MKILIEKLLDITQGSSGKKTLREKFQNIRKLVKKLTNNEKVNNPINEKDLKDLLGVQKNYER